MVIRLGGRSSAGARLAFAARFQQSGGWVAGCGGFGSRSRHERCKRAAKSDFCRGRLTFSCALGHAGEGGGRSRRGRHYGCHLVCAPYRRLILPIAACMAGAQLLAMGPTTRVLRGRGCSGLSSTPGSKSAAARMLQRPRQHGVFCRHSWPISRKQVWAMSARSSMAMRRTPPAAALSRPWSLGELIRIQFMLT